MKTPSCLKLAPAVMRLGVLAILLSLCVSTLSAQDRIILKNGNTLEAKVQEIQVSEIKYKRFDNLNGPVYSLLKSDVFLIMYENGTKEVISELPATSASQTVKPSAQTIKSPKRTVAPTPRQKQPTYRVQALQDVRENIVIGGISLPLSDDGVKMGFFTGYERLWPLSEKFGIAGHGSLSYNKLELYYYDYYGYSYIFKGSEFNTRIMAGPTFRLSAGPSVSFYSTGFVGANINFFTGDFNSTPKTLSLAYGGGTGMLFNEVFDVGLRFINHTAFTATPALYVSAGFRF